MVVTLLVTAGKLTRKGNSIDKSTGAPRDKSKNKNPSKRAPGQKRCSVYKSTSHSDEGCYGQGASRPPQSGGAFIASAMLSTDSPCDDEKPSLNFDDDFNEGCEFTGLVNDSGERGFHRNSDRFTMTVGSGGGQRRVGPLRVPRPLRDSMKDYQKLKEPKTIVTACCEKVATTTGTIWRCIYD